MKKNLLIAGILCLAAFVDGQKGLTSDPATPPSPPDLKTAYRKINPIGPRYQWENNDGYCGETSLISAGLYYGQYVSQYDARALGTSAKPKNSQVHHQLLLGDSNFSKSATALRLNYRQYSSINSRQFLKWVKKGVISGYPVIIGVFNNEKYFYDSTRRTAGDPEYDHIVPVIGWGSARKLNSDDITGDVLLFSDNGLLGDDKTAKPNKSVPYYFPYNIPYFMCSRATANSPTDINRKKRDNRIYALLQLPKYEDKGMDKNNYALLITGVKDPTHQTLPVRLTTSINYEAPFIADSSNTRPRAGKVTLAITVSGLSVGQTYNLYDYTDERQVPTKMFNRQSKNNKILPWRHFTAAATTWQGSLTIATSQKAFFRAVKATAE